MCLVFFNFATNYCFMFSLNIYLCILVMATALSLSLNIFYLTCGIQNYICIYLHFISHFRENHILDLIDLTFNLNKF